MSLDSPGAAVTTAIVAELRYPDGRLASVRVRTGPSEQVRLLAECALGELELRTDGSESVLSMSLANGGRETSTLIDGDLFALEARRAARVLSGDPGDALLAPRDGSLLLALEQSLETGQVTAVEERSSRANFVLITGRGQPTALRRGHLHLVGV